MLKIRYFASVREALKSEGEDIFRPDDVHTLADLVRHLRGIRPEFDALFQGRGEFEHSAGKAGFLSSLSALFQRRKQGSKQLKFAVNQTVVGEDYQLGDDDEVAFFPPMTGG
ncbi:MAG: MoaD/ThiS family protein [Pseudohongiellaceae bacterium]